MKKIVIFTMILLISVPLFVYSREGNGSQLNKDENLEFDKEAVSNLVESFGGKLKFISLLAPKDILKKSMLENYGEFVTRDLLEKWIDDPLNAPGRLTSSPWPDRIEIISIEKLADDVYEVKGKIIEITSTEQENNGDAIRRPITIIVKRTDNRLLISDVTLGCYETKDVIIYENKQYGFHFRLPNNWKGFQIMNEEWDSKQDMKK